MSFASPQFLLLLPAVLLPLILLYWNAERLQARDLRRFVAPRHSSVLSATANLSRRRARQALFLAAITLLLLALARPQWGAHWRTVPARGVDILVAVDLSRSMLAEDVLPNRLRRSRLILQDFVDHLEGDRIGLIGFAGSAFLLCPLTHDYQAFRQTVQTLSPDIMPRGGTDISAAIREAESAFEEGVNYRILILLTDGEAHSGNAIARARAAAQQGLRIFALGIGTPEGGPIPVRSGPGRVDYQRDQEGRIVHTRLDEALLDRVSRETGGAYLRLSPAGDGLLRILDRIRADIPPTEQETRLEPVPIERFPWFLMAALPLLILSWILPEQRFRTATTRPSRATANRRAAITTLVLLSTGVFLAPHSAQALPSRQGLEAFRDGQFDAAEEAFRQDVQSHTRDARRHLNLGAALYRQGRYEEAARAFERALDSPDLDLQADAFHNLGNSLFRQGQEKLPHEIEEVRKHWEDAIARYNDSLELRPDDPNATYNREVVQSLLDELQEPPSRDPGDEESEDHQESGDAGEDPEQPGQQIDPDETDQEEEPEIRPSGEEGLRQDEPEPEVGDSHPPSIIRTEEAEQLLDSLLEQERLLPFTPEEPETEPDAQRVFKDW